MEIVAYILGIIFALIWLWMNVLATFAVRHDSTLEPFQKLAQTLVIWLIPYFGAGLVLHLIWQQYPSSIPETWIPWPFKKMVYGKAPPQNKNRDDNESPAIDGAVSNQTHGVSGFDGGSSSD